jgi:hypothetical protein
LPTEVRSEPVLQPATVIAIMPAAHRARDARAAAAAASMVVIETPPSKFYPLKLRRPAYLPCGQYSNPVPSSEKCTTARADVQQRQSRINLVSCRILRMPAKSLWIVPYVKTMAEIWRP